MASFLSPVHTLIFDNAIILHSSTAGFHFDLTSEFVLCRLHIYIGAGLMYSDVLSGSGNNETNCSETYTTKQKNTLIAVLGFTGFVSFSMCMVAILLVFCLRLHRLFTYRLAMYQVLSAMMYSFLLVLYLGLINYNGDSLPDMIVCKVLAFCDEYFLWVKLLFTISLTFHLFCLAVLLKNFEKLELLYVAFGTLFPLLFSWIPFIHNNYGVAGAWCWIIDWTGDCATQHYLEGIIEQFTLWYGPLFVFLTVSLVAVAVIITILLWRVYKSEFGYQFLVKNPLKHKYKETLNELLPLLAYPVIFYCLYLFPLANRICDAVTPFTSFKLSLAHSFCTSLIGLFSSAVLILHVAVVKCHRRSDSDRRTHRRRGGAQIGTTTPTVRQTTVRITTDYSTAFLLPAESDVDKAFENLR